VASRSRPSGQISISTSGILPRTFTLANFRAVFAQGFAGATRHSIIVAAVVAIVTTILVALER
jgi:ABC-type glycerol-3-phosphate transport system permease component